MSTRSKEQVDVLTEKLRITGVTIVGEPRTTDDGYFESVILDPEGNQIEFTI
ncbi:lactoylglutathione lyase [Maribacter ulvicola]|uniref:Lactoylglutathione lyase n=2 Tax=Maribacter ulvicola TaxID=228959 RepID=A0A1N6P7C1_9FLAO|nr:VOC family protein [Maribacter ulvicola]SIQ00240.1 lactoylglutathione lyase [Maribacter ulvicola]